MSSVKSEDVLPNLEEISDLKSKLKRVPSEDRFGKQGFSYDTKKFREQITETVNKTIENYSQNLKLQQQQLKVLLKNFLKLKKLGF